MKLIRPRPFNIVNAEIDAAADIALSKLESRLQEEIADVILTAPAATIELAAIPAGFAHFLLLWDYVYGDNAGNQLLQLTFNGDGAANYDHSRQVEGGAVVIVHASANIVIGLCGGVGVNNIHSHGSLQIFNRATQQKITFGTEIDTYHAGGVLNNLQKRHLIGKWRNVADEIHTITLTPAIGNFVAGSRVVLMGVRT